MTMHNWLLLICITGTLGAGRANGLYFTETRNRVETPVAVLPAGVDLLQLYVRPRPGEWVANVSCRVRQVSLANSDDISADNNDDENVLLFDVLDDSNVVRAQLHLANNTGNITEDDKVGVYILRLECVGLSAVDSDTAVARAVTSLTVSVLHANNTIAQCTLAHNNRTAAFTERRCFGPDDVTYSVYENSEPGILGNVRLSSIANNDSLLQYTLVEALGLTSGRVYNASFHVDSATGALSLLTSLDRELDSSIQLQIACRAWCADDVTMTAVKNFTLVLLDVNDNGPMIVNRFDEHTTYEMIDEEPAVLKKDAHISSHAIIDLDTAENNRYEVIIISNHTGQLKASSVRHYSKNSGAIYFTTISFAENWFLDVERYTFDVVFNDTTAKPSVNGENLTTTATFRVNLVLPPRDSEQQEELPPTTTTTTPAPTQPTPSVRIIARLYSAAVAVTAQKYSRLMTLSNHLSGSWEYAAGSMPLDNITGAVFNITPHSGIVYVNNATSLESLSESEVVHFRATSLEQPHVFLIQIRITVYRATQPQSPVVGSCDDGCSVFSNADDCETNCGYGSPRGVCSWRRNNHTLSVSPRYETCTPEVRFCPDGNCDELERMVPSLCAQDCTVKVVGGPYYLNPKTDPSRGIVSAVSPCWCNRRQQCTCLRPLQHDDQVDEESISSMEPRRNGVSSPQRVTRAERTTRRSVATRHELFNTAGGGCTFVCQLSIVIAVTSIAIVATVTVACFFYRREKNARHTKHVGSLLSLAVVPSDYVDDQERHLPPNGACVALDSAFWSRELRAANQFDPKWEFARKNLILGKVLGEGEFGRVVQAEVYGIGGKNTKTTVAVKMLKDCASEGELRDLLSEYHLLKDVDHRNVIKLLGACTTNGPFYVIVEYCEYGSLRTFLRQYRHKSFTSPNQPSPPPPPPPPPASQQTQTNAAATTIATEENTTAAPNKHSEPKADDEKNVPDVLLPKDLLSFAWQTANGMNYLSGMKLVHRDLAARNILLGKDMLVKISDFGLTRDIYEENAYLKKSKDRMPVKWMAPESLYDQISTSKSDVWSYGIVLWEIVTLGAVPYPGIFSERLFQLIKTGYTMEKPVNCSEDLFDVMKQCWRMEPNDRPTFKELANTFEEMLRQDVEYLDLEGVMNTDVPLEEMPEPPPWEQIDEVSSQGSDPAYGQITMVSVENHDYVCPAAGHGDKKKKPRYVNSVASEPTPNDVIDEVTEGTQLLQRQTTDCANGAKREMETDCLISGNGDINGHSHQMTEVYA